MPKRIHRKRTKGWKMPKGAVSVTRPGKWGNPFVVSPTRKPGSRTGVCYFAVQTTEEAVETYREMLKQTPAMVVEAIAELGGKDLACFCKLTEPCHADVLLEIANPGIKIQRPDVQKDLINA